jgi:Tol biopolymer transport system component
VCENRFSTYVVSLAGREPVPLPGVFHSWSPTGDTLACNGDYAYPSHHGELEPYLLDTTMVGVPVVRLVSPQGRVRLEQRNAVFLRWSPDGAQMILRSTQPQRDAGLLLYLARTTATASTKATPLCQAPAWVTWHPGGDLLAWSNARGCFVTNTRLKQTARVTGSVAGGWCQWSPKADPTRLLYVDADHLQVADQAGNVLARVDNATSRERSRDGRTPAPQASPSQPPDLTWSPDGARFAVADGRRARVYPLDTLVPETELVIAGPDGAGGGQSLAHRPTQPSRRLVGWTAAPQ